jgi:hypothetical protein
VHDSFVSMPLERVCMYVCYCNYIMKLEDQRYQNSTVPSHAATLRQQMEQTITIYASNHINYQHEFINNYKCQIVDPITDSTDNTTQPRNMVNNTFANVIVYNNLQPAQNVNEVHLLTN